MMWRGNCVQCGQTDKLGWSHCWAQGFWCQACHDHLDEDEQMAPVAPPRWDGGDWGEEPTVKDIEEYLENGGLLEQSFHIDNEEISVVSDPQRYLFKGIGGSIWNASIQLASFLQGVGRTLKEDPVILELGAGCGIPSVHFARTHPRARVVTTDVPHLLPLLRYNARGVANLEVAPLTWGTAEHMAPYLDGRLDLIIAADVVFDEDFHSAFIETLRKLSLGTPEAPRRTPARIILAMAIRAQEVEFFLEATRRHSMELSELVTLPGPDPWASDVGIYDCFFHPPAPAPSRKRAASTLSDVSTACSSPSSSAAQVLTP
jgi:precorrin-6B methylase 2